MASSARACRACQRRLMDVVHSFTGYSSNTRRCLALRPIIDHQLHRSQPGRSFYNSAFRRLPEQQQSNPNVSATDESDSPSAITEQSDPSSSSSSAAPSSNPQFSSDASIPWYLRVEPPAPPAPTFPHLAAQEMPPLPANPPELLLPILQHLSISIGLDNLCLLDLRDLSPPSALGTNLLMIIGTARSHKHLNTSADRFCRWLRSTYKLRPYADGLLGRNELKLKLRRRNRRLKLAQSVGNTTAIGGEDSDGKYDSGITTGWICCNLGAVGEPVVSGTVDNAEVAAAADVMLDGNVQTSKQIEHVVLSEKDQERILEDEDAEYKNPADGDFKYRGFGSMSNAPRIVVQMFTEEKRMEMDLEGLWETRIQRREKKEEKRDQEFANQLFETERIEEELMGDKPTVREGVREPRSGYV